MNALRNIQLALVPGGIAVDTQPVSARPTLTADERELGTADMRRWVETVRDLDRRAALVIREGRYSVSHEEHLTVTDTFSCGAECAKVMRGWRGTQLPSGLARRLATIEAEVQLHQQVRLRLLMTADQGRA